MEDWTEQAVMLKHRYHITSKAIAKEIGISEQYVCYILKKKRTPFGACEMVMGAIERLIEKTA